MMFSLSANVLAAGAENLPFEDSAFFETGDYSIHYRVWEAEEEKAKILMIHGFALSTYCWENLAEILVENGYTCVMADLPDFGYSSRETAETEKLPREDVMYALIQSLGGGEWYVAGHSMGGYVALALQQKYPDTVKNVLLYGTSANEGTSDFLTSIMTNELFISVMGPLMQLMVRMTIFVKLFLAVSLSDNEYAENYDAKTGISNSYMNIDTQKIIDGDEIFGSVTRVGIDKKKNDEAFFKKEFRTLKKGWSFGVYLTLDFKEDETLQLDPVVFLAFY